MYRSVYMGRMFDYPRQSEDLGEDQLPSWPDEFVEQRIHNGAEVVHLSQKVRAFLGEVHHAVRLKVTLVAIVMVGYASRHTPDPVTLRLALRPSMTGARMRVEVDGRRPGGATDSTADLARILDPVVQAHGTSTTESGITTWADIWLTPY